MIVAMPRDGAIIFSDLIGKLDVLRVSCEKCGREGRYSLTYLITDRGRDAKVIISARREYFKHSTAAPRRQWGAPSAALLG